MQTIVALRENHKPVEAYIHPDEYHIKWQPTQRYSIYRRNIQWLKFWLQDVEESDPIYPDQYERWRKLREQHEANLRAKIQTEARESLPSH